MKNESMLIGVAGLILGAMIAFAYLTMFAQVHDQNNNGTCLVAGMDSGAEAPAQQESANIAEKVSLQGSVKGDPNAPVKIIEYSDFECPYCAKFYKETLPLIEKEYISTGKAKLEYRHFPLAFHKNAQKAAEASECAADQGKFWEMHDIIFENQEQIAIDDLKTYAVQIGLDVQEFNECLDSGIKSAKIRDDVASGKDAGVSGTPSFLINGRLVVGAQPYAVFKQVIDGELAKKSS